MVRSCCFMCYQYTQSDYRPRAETDTTDIGPVYVPDIIVYAIYYTACWVRTIIPKTVLPCYLPTCPGTLPSHLDWLALLLF